VTRWRLSLVALLLALIAWPLVMPFADLGRQPSAWDAWEEYDRLADLARNTLLLVSGTLALALPVGIAGAVLLYRSDLPLREPLRMLTVLALFVPLPFFASAWQATFGTSGWLPVAVWTTPPPPGDPDISPAGIPWKPWAHGLVPAIFVHAMAGLPWVVWIVGHGLTWVERELEEEALLSAGPWQVLWTVTLPRSGASVFAAGLWVALQTATEVTITDMMQVRTFAEEVFVQLTRPELSDADLVAQAVLVAQALAVSVPLVVLTGAVIVWAARRWERSLPPLGSVSEPLCLFPLGWGRGPLLAIVLLLVALAAGVPVSSLVWKAGLAGSPQAWSPPTAGRNVWNVLLAQGSMVARSVVLAAIAGGVTAALALVGCWLATEKRWLYGLLLILLAAAWALPGPVIGIGMKDTINRLVDGERWLAKVFGGSGHGPLEMALYQGPSPLPELWAVMLRFFPCALAILWPVVRLLPVELRDTARLEGASPAQELRYLVWPLTAKTWLRAALAVMVLSLGELGASKLVETPGSQTLAHEIFNQMHYGVTNHVAALCLVLLGMVGAGGALVTVAGWLKPR
jgi:iron(III) transport system permease protein